MDRRKFLKYTIGTVVGVPTLALIARELFSISEYADMPGFDADYEAGRTRNSLATLVSGIVGQKMYGSSKFELNMEKSQFPDAKVTGHTTRDTIDSYVGLALTSSHFTAARKNGLLEGTVAKSEFNWGIKENDDGSYHVTRFGPKFDSELRIDVKDGKITGQYIRTGPHFSWTISGKYDEQGNVKIDVSIPLGLDFRLKGKITKN